MAKIQGSNKPKVLTIEKFLGRNEAGDTELQLGESPGMVNFRVVNDYDLKSIEGYDSIVNKTTAIQGMWYGKIEGSYHFLYACEGKIFELNLADNSSTQIGTLTDSKTTFFSYNDKVYILNGYEYKVYDGTSVTDVIGYIPTIRIGTPPTGGGTAYEQVNLLTGKKKQLFNGDGTSVTFTIAENNVESIDEVKVAGNVVTPASLDIVNGTVTLNSPPANIPDVVEIQWTKTEPTHRQIIEKCKYMMAFGGDNDTRVFVWGNDDLRNRCYRSTLNVYGVPDPTYFPENEYAVVGSSEFAITDVVRQYDRQIYYKENEAYYSYFELNNGKASFPIYPLNSATGNLAPKQVQLVDNKPITFTNRGIYEWVSTNIRDERNAQYISKRVQPSLNKVDLSKAITIDYEKKGELWIAVNNNVWVYNYRLDVWYVFELSDNVTCFALVNDIIYFGTDNGDIMRFNEESRSFAGNEIKKYWDSGFFDFGQAYKLKTIDRIYFSMKPHSRSKAEISYKTNKTSSNTPMIASYNFATFEHTNFAHFSFNISRNPQPFTFKKKIKKFAYIQYIIKNNSSDEILEILKLSVRYLLGGESR